MTSTSTATRTSARGVRREWGAGAGRSPLPAAYRHALADAPPLTAAEERALAGRVLAGDRAARDRLVEANLRLVVTIAFRYARYGLELDDLIAEGNLGLVRAADRYDGRPGVRFAIYAAWWIKKAIRAALTNTASALRVPGHLAKPLRAWRAAERRLALELGRAPQFDEVADALALPEDRRALLRRALAARRAAGEAADAGGCRRPPEELAAAGAAPSAALAAADERAELYRRLGRLDARERAIVELRHGLAGEGPLTLVEVGARLGINREWVRKLELQALERLARPTPAAGEPLVRAAGAKAAAAGRLYPSWAEVLDAARELGRSRNRAC